MPIHKKVKKLLIDQDLTVAKLAEKTGYSRVHMSNVINGHFEAPEVRLKVAKVLEQDFSELWNEQDTPPPPRMIRT